MNLGNVPVQCNHFLSHPGTLTYFNGFPNQELQKDKWWNLQKKKLNKLIWLKKEA